MEFDFDVNELLPNVITKIGYEQNRVIPDGKSSGSWSLQDESQLESIIDRMGYASARAQGLHIPITTGQKFKNSDHIIYIMKNARANNGLGSVVGILRSGRKLLFLNDQNGTTHEMTPLCLLDFYVHESCQRTGCGLRLFQHFIKEENTSPQLIAIDKPSEKLLSFLKRHYNLSNFLQQGNNYTVFKEIFATHNEGEKCVLRARPLDKRTNSLRSNNTNRHSFPSFNTRNSSSVGAVVFGDGSSINGEGWETASLNSPNSLNKTSSLESSEAIPCKTAWRRSYRDSSFNIFGVPSPPNRHGLH